MNLKILCPLLILILFFGCKNQEKKGVTNNDESIEKKLGGSFERDTKGEFSLCTRELENGRIIFLIFNEKTKSITLEPTKLNGSVSWIENDIVKVQNRPEIIEDKQGQDSYVYYINAKNGEKTTLKQK